VTAAPAITSRHLLSVAELGRDGIAEVLRVAERFVEVNARPIPKVPALRGKTVATLFFEGSTRTRLSFETAARRLSADVVTFTPSTSSLGKGESIRDTVETLDALGADAIVVRHRAAGVPWQVARWSRHAAVINGGDGWHEHPTQALLDCLTLLQERRRRGGPDSLEGLRIGIVGDIRHSRVARSGVVAFSALGAEVSLCGPPTLLPPSLEGWPVQVRHDLDGLLGDLDVVYLLRLQHERMEEALLPSQREYTARYGLTLQRARRLEPDVLVLHPGPINRGVELAAEVADRPGVLITRQVANGVALRMAVLYLLLGPGVDVNGL
jgi:aspartate carbamoyltransferase catalytic subunit